MIADSTQSALYHRLTHQPSWVGAYCGVDMNHLPKQGEMVVVGFCMAPQLYRIGYVVQIRLKQGDAGSHNLLIRHADGSLHQHSNNMYAPVSPEDLEALLPFFACKPEAEDYDKGYSVGRPDSHAVGFLVE